MKKVFLYTVLALALTSCIGSGWFELNFNDPVTDEELKTMVRDLDYNVLVNIIGIPNKGNSRDLILEANPDENLKTSVSLGVGYSSDGHSLPIAVPHHYSDRDYFYYGNRQDYYEIFSYIVSDSFKVNKLTYTHEALPVKNNDLLIRITFRASGIVSKDYDKEVTLTVGAGEENASGAIGMSLADRTNCRAEQELNVQFVQHGKVSKLIPIKIKGELIKIKNQNAAKQAYTHTSEQTSREIIRALFNYLDGEK